MSLFVSKTFCLSPFMEVFNNNSIYKKETSFIPLRANSSRSSAGYVCVHVCVCVCVCFAIQVLHQSRYKNGSGTSFWHLPLHLQISIQGTCSKKHWYCSVYFLFLQSQKTNSISSGLIVYPVNFISSIYFAPIMLISLRNLLVFF